MKKKWLDVLSALTVISGCFVLFFYGINLGKSLLLASGIRDILLSAVVMGAAGSAIALRRRLWVWLRAVLCLGMCFYMITFSVFLGWIGLYHTAPLPEDTQFAVLVFGCRTYGMNPGRTLAYRLNSALEVLESHPDAVCVVSGGQGSNETVPEADAMAGYLIDRGIDESRILIERLSHNTVENLKFSMELLEENGLGELPIVAVSNSFHIPRIVMLANRQDITLLTAVGAPSSNPLYYFADSVREYMAWVKALLLN